MFDFYIKKGDRLPDLEAVLKYDNGEIINLTGATVKFLFKKPGGVAVVGTAVVVVAAEGSVRYEWGATDTDTKGLMIGEFEATLGGLKLTVPNFRHLNILVHEDIG